MSSIHRSQDHFKSCLQIEQHIVLTLSPNNYHAFECTVKLTRPSDFDATQDADTLASIYINSDDTAGYALAW